MLSIFLKAILIYAIFCIAKGIYNVYQLSKKLRSHSNQNTKSSPPNDKQEIFEAKFRHLKDDD